MAVIDSQAFNQFLDDFNPSNLGGTFLFYGQTPFLSDENALSLVTYAKANGFSCREIFYIDNRSKFQEIFDSLSSPGLFDPKKIIELRLDTEKPVKKIGEQLKRLAQMQSANLIVIQARNINYKTQKEQWFVDVVQAATTVVSKPIYPNQIPNWIHQRAASLGLQLSSDALKKIMQYSEGNLLWTHQILMQLVNSDYPRPIEVEVIERILADMSVFQIEDLSQALFNKEPRALKIIHKLQQENESLVFLNTVLFRDFLKLEAILNTGMPLQQACRQLKIWQSKQRLYQSALSHYQLPHIKMALIRFAELDKISKGQAKGDGWLLLNKLVAELLK